MKGFLATVFLNFGFYKSAEKADILMANVQSKSQVDAATPTCSTCI
jgi:hypothetical protein